MAELVSSVARRERKRKGRKKISPDESPARAIIRRRPRREMRSPVNESPTSLGRSLISVRLAGGNACAIDTRGKSAREEEHMGSVLRYERPDRGRPDD